MKPLSGTGSETRRVQVRELFALCVCVLVVAFILVPPVAGLIHRGGFPVDGRDLRHFNQNQIYFAWQMFTNVDRPSVYEVYSPDGSSVLVDTREAYGRFSGRTHYSPALARRVCEDHDGALEVRWGSRHWTC